MHNFRQLSVWQKAMDLATEVYRLSTAFPAEEKFGLTSQLRRCVISIPSNIAEGSGRGTDKEFALFLSYSLGSAYEVETQLVLATRLGLITAEALKPIEEQIVEVQRMLHGLSKKLKA